MPYIAPIPAVVDPTMGGTAIKYPGVLAGQTNGTVFTFDHSPPLANIALQLSAIQSALNGGPGGTSAREPGTLLYFLANSAGSLSDISKCLNLLITGNNEAVGAALNGAHSVQSSLSTIAGLMSTMIAMQQMSLADQIKHNEFQETATNVARQEQDPNKPPITVPPTSVTTKIKDATSNIATIQSTASAAGVATTIATDALSSGADIAKNLVSATDVGQTLIGYGTSIKKYVTTQVADVQAAATAKAKERDANTIKVKTSGG